MSEEKYPDTIELKLTLRFSDAHKIDSTMRKYIEISEETLNAFESGKYVKGTLHRDPETNKIVFNAWKCKPRKKTADKLVCHLPNGWVKESPQRIKFFNSVKKAIGQRMIEVEMHRDLNTGMQAYEKQNILSTNNTTK